MQNFPHLSHSFKLSCKAQTVQHSIGKKIDIRDHGEHVRGRREEEPPGADRGGEGVPAVVGQSRGLPPQHTDCARSVITSANKC